jgi:hypothetical protein
MTDTKPERLGLRGRLAHFESALRLLGGANATGAIAGGVAFHAFESNAEIQSAVKSAAILFLFGIFTFTIAYAALFVATDDIDHSMHKPGEETWPEYLFWIPSKSPEQYKTAAKWEFTVALFGGLASFVLFLCGLAAILFMATHLQFGSSG